jgi:hypothetical protein
LLPIVTVDNRLPVEPPDAIRASVIGDENVRPRLTSKQIAAVAAGNALEFYDFVTTASSRSRSAGACSPAIPRSR